MGKALSNQELRTRKDLLRAAGALVKQGRKPSMEEVAKEAMVSRATAYRYFKNIDDLLVEAPIDAAVKDPQEVFSNLDTDDPEDRIDVAEASMHRVVYESENALRIMLANTIAQGVDSDGTPRRQNRRTALIEQALKPARKRFEDEVYERLCAALAIIFGPESMIVFRDVLQADDKEAREVKGWAARALVRAALKDSG